MKIAAAAIRTARDEPRDGRGRVFTDICHGLCYAAAEAAGEFENIAAWEVWTEDGFVTDEGDFVSREEAQLINEGRGTVPGVAVSEDFLFRFNITVAA